MPPVCWQHLVKQAGGEEKQKRPFYGSTVGQCVILGADNKGLGEAVIVRCNFKEMFFSVCLFVLENVKIAYSLT